MGHGRNERKRAVARFSNGTVARLFAALVSIFRSCARHARLDYQCSQPARYRTLTTDSLSPTCVPEASDAIEDAPSAVGWPPRAACLPVGAGDRAAGVDPLQSFAEAISPPRTRRSPEAFLPGYDQQMVRTDQTRPSRSYVPWARWLFTLAAVLLLAAAARPDFPGLIRVAAAGVAIVALLTHRPIHQMFILVDAHATVRMRASASWFGNVCVRITSSGETHVIQLGRIGWLTKQMHFEARFGDTPRSFSLGHLTNTRYFLLGENAPLNVQRAVVQENVFCF